MKMEHGSIKIMGMVNGEVSNRIESNSIQYGEA